MSVEKITGIYCIENIITGKKYIGQSIDIKERWRHHISELNLNSHYNNYLQNAWNKYGKDAFIFYVIEYCNVDELDEKEIYYIDFYKTLNRNNGYNLKSGGQFKKNIYSKDLKEKISNAIKKTYDDPDRRLIQSKNAIKQWSNYEIKKKIIGENNGMYGKHHSEESKKKMSEAKSGKRSWNRNTTPVVCIELNKIFNDCTDAGKELNINSSGILKVCKHERKTAGGYHFEFIKEKESNVS